MFCKHLQDGQIFAKGQEWMFEISPRREIYMEECNNIHRLHCWCKPREEKIMNIEKGIKNTFKFSVGDKVFEFEMIWDLMDTDIDRA